MIYVWDLAIDPVTPSTLYVGTINGELFKSTDSGEAWVWLLESTAHSSGGGAFYTVFNDRLVLSSFTPNAAFTAFAFSRKTAGLRDEERRPGIS